MTLNELIIQKLTERYPDKKFHMLVEVDKISFTPWVRLTVNGRATKFGYNPERAMDLRSIHGMTDEDIAVGFVQNIALSEQLGITL